MRVLLLLIALVVIAIVLGWVTFSPGPERSTINIEKQEIREDTRELLDSGAKIVNQADEGIDRAADRDEPAATRQDSE
jgi:beta-lactam-binding protein with PASTA domain